jgi:hypothetical protein
MSIYITYGEIAKMFSVKLDHYRFRKSLVDLSLLDVFQGESFRTTAKEVGSR